MTMPKNLTPEEQTQWKAKQVERVKEWVKNNPEKATKNKRNYYDKNKSKVIESANEWRKNNPDRHLLHVQNYQLKHHQKLMMLSREYYKNNKEKVTEYHRKYRELNKLVIKTRVRNSQKKNPLRLRIAKYVRRIRVGNDRISTKRVKELFLIQKGKCNYCSCDLHSYHIDHIIPLALGGSNSDCNIQLLCPPCNRRKGAKHPDTLDWISK